LAEGVSGPRRTQRNRRRDPQEQQRPTHATRKYHPPEQAFPL
jgi:hypothetical protein